MLDPQKHINYSVSMERTCAKIRILFSKIPIVNNSHHLPLPSENKNLFNDFVKKNVACCCGAFIWLFLPLPSIIITKAVSYRLNYLQSCWIQIKSSCGIKIAKLLLRLYLLGIKMVKLSHWALQCSEVIRFLTKLFLQYTLITKGQI